MRPCPTARVQGAAVAALAALTLCAHVHAQPANDACAEAVPLVPGVPAGGTTAGATMDMNIGGACPEEDTSEVWYSFTAEAAGPYEFTLTGQNNTDLSLAVLSGCEFPVGIFACTIGSGTDPLRLEYQTFSPGETVLLRVGSVSGAGQTFTISAGPLPPPANDECAQAVPLTLGVPLHASNLSATTTLELPLAELCSSIAPGVGAGADVFFSFTPASDGHYDFSTCGAVFDTIVSVHSACPVSAANAIACNDNAPLTRCNEEFATYASYVAGVPLTGGVTYYVRVAGVKTYDPFTGEIGDPGRSPFDLLVAAGSPVPVPANDACENAAALPADSFLEGTTERATGQAGACDPEDPWDVWYSFTSTAAERRVFDFTIFPGSFGAQATLSAYRSCGGELIACQAYNPLTLPDMTLVVALDPGETVLLRVAGRTGTQDEFAILSGTGPVAAPNATCAAAVSVGAGQVITVDTRGAATDDESACGFGDVYPLWYSFTAPQDGYYRFATGVTDPNDQTSLVVTAACDADPIICANQGDSASTDPGAAAVALFLTNGQTVRARVAFNAPRRGEFTFSVDGPLAPPPLVANDVCADAETIGAMPFETQVNITLATPDQDVCASTEQPPVPTRGGVWYRYTPDVDRVFKGSASTQNGGGRVSVFTGICGSLTQVGCPASGFGDPLVPLTAGTTYYILASAAPGPGDPEGSEPVPYGTILEVSLIAPPRPANDDCASAERITASSAEFIVNTLAADADAPAPSCAGSEGLFSNAVWYTFTTQTAGSLTVNGTAHFAYDPAAALFTGGCDALQEVACDNPTDGFFLTDRFSLTAPLQADQTYHLAIGAWFGPAGGDTEITFAYTGQLETTPPCRADFDNANGVQVADIFAFLRAWFANAPSADFDGQNGIQVADIFAFLRAWFAGC